MSTVSQKILKLFESDNENLQRSVARCIPELMNFFENGEQVIAERLKLLPEEPATHLRRGHAYLIAGLVKGLGAEQIEKQQIFELIEREVPTNKKVDQSGLKEANLMLALAIIEVLGKLSEP